MKKYFLILIIFTSLFLLVSVGFVFAQLGLSVPVTDSQLKAVNSALDAIETTLVEHLKNIDLNLFNLLRIQFEDFFRKNYQDKILQIWETQYRLEDFHTLLKDISDESKQKVRLDEYKLNAEYAAAYRTITNLPKHVSCIPGDYRYLAEEYVSSTFAFYDLSKYALSQLSLIPDCEEIQPDFGFNISYQSPTNKPKGFLASALATILQPFSLGRFMLAVNPVDSSFATFTISSGYNENLKTIAIDSFYNVVSQSFASNLDFELENLPDTRNITIPAVQRFTDSKKPITLQYQSLISSNKIFDQQQDLNSYAIKTLTDYDIAFAFATKTFSTDSAKIICQKFGLVEAGQGGTVKPAVACAQSLINVSTDLGSALLGKLRSQKNLLEVVRDAWAEAQSKAQELKATTSPECEEAIKRLDEIIAMSDDNLQHFATVTVDINRVIAELSNHQIDINQTITQVSSTISQINQEYKDIINNINDLLEIFKQKGIEGGSLFGGLPFDFLGAITGKLYSHNAILVLSQADRIVGKIDQILRGADRIVGLLGISTDLFQNLRRDLTRGARPITNSVLVKDYFEIYGIQVEMANLERERSCRNQQVAMKSDSKIYASKEGSKKIAMPDKRAVKKIETVNTNKSNEQNKNFFQKLMAKIFSPKIVEINLR